LARLVKIEEVEAMKINVVSAVLSLGVASLALSACSSDTNSEAPSSAELNLNPKTLDEAAQTLTELDALQKVDSERVRAALVELRPRLDALNHLVARVEVKPGHFISFYEPEPGMIGISEQGPAGEAPLLGGNDLRDNTAVQLYQRFAADAPVPEALLRAQERDVAARVSEVPADNDSALGKDFAVSEMQAPTTDAAGIARQQQSLTGADGPWWAANVCYDTGDFRGCYPNWANGGYAYASAKTSFFQVAPYSGDLVSVRFQYEGSTRFTDPVFNGGWGSWWWHSDSFWDCCGICACGTRDYNRRSHRWDILNASGDAFHWTFSFKWSCGNTLSCDQSP
jgi:hypothetical protein